MKDMDWHNMRTRLEALYVLDNALTGSSEEGLRLVQKKVPLLHFEQIWMHYRFMNKRI